MDRVVTPNGHHARPVARAPYDTARAEAVPAGQERRNPKYPSALNWITSKQLQDGSWGSTIPYVQDRVLCTLAALVPLARYGRRESDRAQVRRGERYLWQHAHLLRQGSSQLVGFEQLLPALVKLAREAGVKVPPPLAAFVGQDEGALETLPSHLVASRRVRVEDSVEFQGPQVDPLQLLTVRAPDGAIGNSPSAPAFLLHHIGDPEAVAYLEECLAGDEGKAVPTLEPYETYDALWSAYHDWLGGTPAMESLPEALRDRLAEALRAEGVKSSPAFAAPDAEETAVALVLFHEAGLAAEATALRRFEREDGFVGYPFEEQPCTGVNVHVLQALSRYPGYPGREEAMAKALRFLQRARQPGGYWLDRWHVSPYYATGRAILALSELEGALADEGAELLAGAVEWVVQTQNEDGSWGFFGVHTCEETAYALLALRAVKAPDERVKEAIRAGATYLVLYEADETRPAMWVDRCLYYPGRIVESAIRAAMAGAASAVSVDRRWSEW